jgi:hypothetical protein
MKSNVDPHLGLRAGSTGAERRALLSSEEKRTYVRLGDFISAVP